MSTSPSVLVVIPSRLAATRLPRKPLIDLAGEPMILHVWRRGVEAAIGPVVVAAADPEIAFAVEAAGGNAVLTDPDLPSGTDRVLAAVDELDPGRTVDLVVNLQGDMPEVDPAYLALALAPVIEDGCDIGTLVVPTDDAAERDDPNCVKAVVSFTDAEQTRGQALYFTRAAAPSGAGPLYHHVGIYGFSRDALERFCDLPPSPLERRERLEQLRALEAGMRIGVRSVPVAPPGIDTPEDLAAARKRFAHSLRPAAGDDA
ncbi:MAG: 3-deoxy-manno-octulosonate cytidylyltransferase [Geminicoccaceae bacterium]|nr:MAG: 3-deoxy-manno-octulosonate cytidylyltransferase [Geminicoccaceae bacterium]